MIVYLDESGMDSRAQYDYGWNAQGQRFWTPTSRRQGQAGWHRKCNQNLIAAFTIEGACNRTVFEGWLESCKIPHLKQDRLW